MSACSACAGKKQALSDNGGAHEAASSGHNANEVVQPLSHQSRQFCAEQNLSTGPSSVASIESNHRFSCRSQREAGQLLSPLVSPSATPHVDFDLIADLSDVDSQATIEMVDVDIELPIARGRANEDSKNSVADGLSRMITINEDEVLTMGSHPAPAEHLQFRCSFPQGCNQWQSKIGASRKCVSDKFGRNKKATRIILFARWCRSHYQQTSYNPSTADRAGLRAWGEMKIPLIRNTLDTIERQQPGILFNVILKKHEMDRLSRDNLHLGPPKPSADTYDSPLPVLRDFVNRGFIREHATRAQVEEVLEWSLDLLNRSVVDDCPCFELIPEWSAESFKKWDWVRVLDRNIAKADKGDARETAQSPPPRAVNSAMAAISADDAGDEDENPNIPVPPRVKKLHQAGRVSKRGAIQKPTLKGANTSRVGRRSFT